MLDLLTDPQAWISLAVLSAMEIILGIDNIVFITILAGRLPPERQAGARRLGLMVALVSRLVLLAGITWVMRLTEPLFTFFVEWSGKDLILLGGGVFLVFKATREIYDNVESPEPHGSVGEEAAAAAGKNAAGQYVSIMIQVMILDLVFSLDSVITAVGMAEHIPVMVVAMVLAVIVMVIFATPVGNFIQAHPSVRVLALAFLVLIGVMLTMEATGQHVSKGYIYAAMGFSLLVETLNLRMRARMRRKRAVTG